MGKRARTVPRRAVTSNQRVTNQPWAWIFLALNPLFIINQIHTIDFYIKAVYIGVVLAVAFITTRNRDYQPNAPVQFNWIELFFMGYVLWGTVALLWSEQPILGFERLVYLMYAVGGYIIGKQTRFWESTLFWNVFIGVAALVGLVGIGMYYFFGTGSPFGFDWIMSAGRPSSTLSYRAYAGTYLVMTLPFMVWFMFSEHIKSTKHFIYSLACFCSTMLFMICSRARSAWIGLLAAAVIMMVYYGWRALRLAPAGDKKLHQVLFFLAIGLAGLTGLSFGVYAQNMEATWFPGLETGWFTGVVVGVAAFVAFLVVTIGLMLLTLAIISNVRTARASSQDNALIRILLGRLIPLVVGLAVVGFLSFEEPSPGLIAGDKNPQKLKGTGKETVTGTVGKSMTLLLEGRSDRLQFWNISSQMLFEESNRGQYEAPSGTGFWLLGTGIGQWPVYVPIYSNILHSLGAEVHNDWIQAWVETGIFGFICWCGIFVSMFYYASRRYRNMLMIACVGGLFAWFFSTQTDFLTARIYGLLWLGGMAAMIDGIAKPRKVVSLSWLTHLNMARLGTAAFVVGGVAVYAMDNFGSTAGIGVGLAFVACGVFSIITLSNLETSRRMAACFFLYLAAGYFITAWCDRQIYRALVDSNPPVDQLVDIIFDEENFPSYQYGIGKYLIFSPITDLSRAVSKNLQDNKVPETQRRTFDNVQERLAKEVLWMHPYNHNAVALLADITTRRKNYDEALELNERYLDIRPRDAQMHLFKAQTLLDIKDSLEAGKAIHMARTVSPNNQLAMQFWQTRINEQTRRQVISDLGEFEFNLNDDDDEVDVLTPDTEAAPADTTDVAL